MRFKTNIQAFAFLFCLLSGQSLIGQDHWTVSGEGINPGFRSLDIAVTPEGELIAVGHQRAASPYNFMRACFISSDSGRTWIEDTLAGISKNVSFFHAVLAVGDIRFISGSQESIGPGRMVFKSIDGGQNWYFSSEGMVGGFDSYDLVLMPDGEILAAGTRRLSANDWSPGIYQSADTAQNWTLLPTSGLPETGKYFAIEYTGSSLLLSNGTQIFRSEDRGNTWQASVHGLPKNRFVYKMETLPSGMVLAVGLFIDSFNTDLHYPAIYRSVDDGRSWTQFDPSGIEGASVFFAIADNDTFVFMSTSNTIYKSPLEQGDLTKIHSFTVSETNSAYTIYPNPCYSCGSVQLTDYSKTVRGIRLMDMQGREMLNISPDASGILNLPPLPTGIYVVQVLLQGGSITYQRLVVQY